MAGTPEPDDDLAVYLRRADLLDDLGHYEEAVDELRQAVALAPHDVAVLAALGRGELRAGRGTAALAAAENALALAPDDVPAQVVRGYALAVLGRTEDALDAADRLVTLEPGSWLTQLHVAAIVRRVRNGQRALNAAWEAVRLAPDQPATHLELAVVATGLGLVDVAERAEQEARRLDPGAGLADHDLAELRVRPERRIEAAALREPAVAAALDEPVRRELTWTVYSGAIYSWVVPVTLAYLVGLDAGTNWLFAWLFAGLGVVGGLLRVARLRASLGPGQLGMVVRALDLTPQDRWLGAALIAVAAVPLALVAHAVTAAPWPLGVTIALGTFALLAVTVLGRGNTPLRWWDGR